jgi:hypothetical protein
LANDIGTGIFAVLGMCLIPVIMVLGIKSCEEGENHGTCYSNKTCNAGLSCLEYGTGGTLCVKPNTVKIDGKVVNPDGAR